MRHKLEAGLPAIALQSGGALASAFANDVDPELVYAQQVQVLGQPGDVLFCITTSGNSKNVLRAAEVARAKGLRVIGMTSRSGGALAPMSDLCMRAPASETFLVQEFHLPIYHAICMVLENHFFG
jgi:D-sedoheptulose 7-phosphate isomerase